MLSVRHCVRTTTRWSAQSTPLRKKGHASGRRAFTCWTWGDATCGQIGNGSLFGYEAFPVRVTQRTHLEDTNAPPLLVSRIAAGFYHTLAISESNQQAYYWGWATFQGYQGPDERSIPNQISAPNINAVVGIAGGRRHTCLLDDKGKLYTFGVGENFQLGHGNDQDLKTPTLVQGLADRVVTKVVAGWAHTLALTDTNEVFSWGWNEQGQCGQGLAYSIIAVPKLIDCFKGIKIVDIAAGTDHSLFLDAEGNLYVCGNNVSYQLGHDTCHQRVPTPVPLKLKMFEFAHVPISRMSGGDSHSIVLDANGTMWGFGFNKEGQCGHPRDNTHIKVPTPIPTDVKFKDVACGRVHTVAVSVDGSAFSFGRGRNGRLGVQDFVEYADTPQPVFFAETDENGDLVPISCEVVAVACGLDHTVAMVKE